MECGATAVEPSQFGEEEAARCLACGTRFFVGERPASAAPDLAAMEASPPESIRVRRAAAPPPASGGYREAPAAGSAALTVSRRWYRSGHLFILLFGLAFLAFGGCVWWPITSVGRQMHAAAHTPVPPALWLISLLPFLIAAPIVLGALVGLINRTRITLGADGLRVRHRPLPWLGQPTLPVAAIESLYVSEKISQHTDRRGRRFTTRRYLLRARADGEDLKLLDCGDSREQAAYVQFLLEAQLQALRA